MVGSGNGYSKSGRLPLSATATPIFGNNQTDDPSCAGAAGRTRSLRIGVHLSGRRRNPAPPRGKGTRDWPPGGTPGGSGEGFSRSSVGSSSGSVPELSVSARLDGGQLETSAGHISGSVSTSGLSVKSPGRFWSGPEGDSNGASNTMGVASGRAGLVVRDSFISTGSSVAQGISIRGSMASATGAGTGSGGETSMGSCSWGIMPTISNSWSWRIGWQVCISWSRYCTGLSVSIVASQPLGFGVGLRCAALTVLSRGFLACLRSRSLCGVLLSGCTLSKKRGFPLHAPRVRLLQEF